MNLFHLLQQARASGRPVRAGLIGAGKFGSMFLAQVPFTEGLSVSAIADLSPARARSACRVVGWDEARVAATAFIEDGKALAARDDVDVVIEATGHPAAGIAHARAAIAAGKHVVMVNVEADVLAGPLLAAEAASAGVVYSLAYGDQPALVAEMVDWARACGFRVVAAGKGTKYLPEYHSVTPAGVWAHYGLKPEEAKAAGVNPQMFNSFLDGTKSAIEMAAIANACGLDAPEDGLAFPPCGVDDLPHVLRPRKAGGVLERSGTVEVVSSLERDGRPVFRDLRWGVYVVIEAPSDYAAACFSQYGLKTDASGRYAAMYKPYHLIGLELNISVLSAALRREPTGAPRGFRGDAVAVAKRALKAGETLDGEGGFTVWGKLLPAARSLAEGALPIGLAHGVKLKRAVETGAPIRWADVEIDETADAVRTRRAMEARFAAAAS
ncbi:MULTISPECIES: SAF domain-containing protein [Rhodomicrobium]|uniref:NAD(P)H-dependent oxidoreductase n=1 Tax=Rhodomicrobium TaxID=1068 RepID=UPI000B4ACF90|nr:MULTISPECIES: SAF domain-containing protein [Rhodomicrobium]